MAARIKEVRFESSVKPTLSFEIMQYSKLIARVLPNPVHAPTRFHFHLLYFVTAGRTRHSIDFQEQPISAGDLVFLAPGRVQQYAAAPGLEMTMVLFTPEFLSRSFDAREEDPLRTAQVLSPFLDPAVVRLPLKLRGELATLLAQMQTEYDRPIDAVQPAVLSALLKTFLLKAERHVVAQPPVRKTVTPPLAERFRDLLERDFHRERSVKVYAQRLGVTPRTLNSVTSRAFGRTAKGYIDERVVLELKRLLAHTDASVKALSAQFGFEDPTNLVKFFRHHVQQTPMEFRQRSVSVP